MLISIVIPAKNEEKYLGKTLESIKNLETNGFNTEVIVVNGGSTDKTPLIAKKYHTRLIKTAGKGGIGYVRQVGLKAAKGEIVAFTDADTIVPANWLIKLVQTLSKPKVVAVYGGVRVYDGWWIYKLYINIIQPILVRLASFLGNHLGHGGNMAFWREKILSVGGFDEKLMLFEDIEIMKKAKTIGKIIYLPNLIVSSSGRRGDEGWKFFWRNFKNAWDYYIRRRPIPTYPEFR